jgi:hypothetical protein
MSVYPVVSVAHDTGFHQEGEVGVAGAVVLAQPAFMGVAVWAGDAVSSCVLVTLTVLVCVLSVSCRGISRAKRDSRARHLGVGR